MKNFKYTITDPDGIHARPAGLFIKKASGYKSSVSIEKGEKKADAKRLFSLMGLGVKGGDTINVTVDGEDEATASEALENFFKENL